MPVFLNPNQDPLVVPDVTATNDGCMTSAMLTQLNSLVAGVNVIQIYSNATRPAANAAIVGAVVGVKAGVIWNSTSKKPNFSDGVNWYNAEGQLT